MSCDYHVSAKKPDELIPQIAQHAKDAHSIDEVSDDLKQKINGAIKKKIF